LREQVLDLRAENQELKETQTVSDSYNMKFENNVYYNMLNKKVDDPFCSACWDKDKKPIRLHKYDNDEYMK